MVVSESYLLNLVGDKKFFEQPLPELINLPGDSRSLHFLLGDDFFSLAASRLILFLLLITGSTMAQLVARSMFEPILPFLAYPKRQFALFLNLSQMIGG